MATYPTYVVNQDWTTFTAHQPGADYTGNPNKYVYAETGFGSIYQTIEDGNVDNPTLVAGAVGVATAQGNLASPIDLTKGYTIAVVKGDFNETATIPATSPELPLTEEGAPVMKTTSFTLDFSSLYGAPAEGKDDLRTKFVGSFIASEGSNVGFKVSSGEVFFGKTAVYENIYKKDGDGHFLDADNNIIDLNEADAESKKVVIGQENTNRTTLTLTKDYATGQGGFVVGGDTSNDSSATAFLENTALTAINGVWVGNSYNTNETGSSVRYHMVLDDSTLTVSEVNNGLQVRNTGDFVARNKSIVNVAGAVFRGNGTFTDSEFIVQSQYNYNNFNVYGKGKEVTLALTRSTLKSNRNASFQTSGDSPFYLQIGHENITDRVGVVSLTGSTITGYQFAATDPGYALHPGLEYLDIYISLQGTLTLEQDIQVEGEGDDATTTITESKVQAKTITNGGTINISVFDDPNSTTKDQDWIIADKFYLMKGDFTDNRVAEDKRITFKDTNGIVNIDVAALNAANWQGVKRVIYANNLLTDPELDVEHQVFIGTFDSDKNLVVDNRYDAATSRGKVAIAKGVDYRVLYVNHANLEDAQFAQTVTVNFGLGPDADGQPVTTEAKDYYVAFNAFSDAGNAVAKRKDDVLVDKKPTKIILLDGTEENLTYTGGYYVDPEAAEKVVLDFDGLTFLRYGYVETVENEEVNHKFDVSVTFSGAEAANGQRVIVKGFTVGEGVTFAADSVVQLGADAVTTINGTLNVLKSNTLVVPSDASKGYVPSFRVGGGQLNFTAGSTLTSERIYDNNKLIGGGNLDVNATNRYGKDVPGHYDGEPIPATMTVDGANVNLYQLTIGSNATVTLKNMKIVEAQDAVVGKPGAVFDIIQLKNPQAIDFDKPLLKLENTDVTVNKVFDARYGVVDMDMKSTLRVLPTYTTIDAGTEYEHVVETPAEIGGGTFHLTINSIGDGEEYEIDTNVKFYKLVYAKLNSNVVLSCNDDVSTTQNGKVIINGETTSYIYTSLAKNNVGQGLFVMDESIRANLFVKTDWDNGAYTFGDMIADGMYYQINAFGKLVEALETAASYEAGTTITVYGDDTTGIHNETPTVTVTVDDLMTGDVTIQGEKTVVGEGADAEAVYAPIQIVVPFNGAQFFLTAAEGKTITIAKNASLELVREEATTTEVPAISSYAWLGFGSDYERTGGAIQIDGSVYGEGQLTLACKTTISETGSIEAGEALQIIPVIFGEEDDTAEEKQAKAAASRVSVTGTGDYTLASAPQVKAQTLSVLRGEFDTKDSFVQCKSLALSGESDINSDNTIWKVTSNIAAYAAGDVDGDWYPVPTGTYSFKNGSVVTVTGEDGNTSDRANFPTYTGNAPVSGNAQFDAAGMTVVFDNSELNVAKSLINAGTLTIDNGSTVKVNTTATYSEETVFNGVLNTGSIEVKSGSLLSVYNNSYGIKNSGAIDVVGGTIWAKKPTGATYYIDNKTANAVITLNDATILLTGDLNNQIRNWDNATIQIDGNVSFTFQPGTSLQQSINGTIINQVGPANTANAGKVVFGVINTGTANGGKNVDLNIVGGTVAFSKAGLTFDMAVTGVENAGADEAIVSAKLSGGTIFVDKEDITLTDSGFKVVDQAVDPEANPPVTEEVSHMVWNNTNSIKIAGGTAALDTEVAGWNNYADDRGKTNKVSLTVRDLTIADGGNLKMDWKQCLTVTGTLTAVEAKSIKVDLSEGFELLDNDKLVIAYGTANTTIDDFSFVEKYKKYFEVHHENDWVDPEDETKGKWTVTGLYLDSSAFIKVSATHDEDHTNGWYKKITDASNVNRAAVMLILDGDFSSEGYVFLNNIETNVRGGNGYSDDPTKIINPPVLPSVTVAGNYVNRLVDDEETLPEYAEVQTFGGLTIKYVQEDTSLTINSCTTTGGWIFGGDFFSAYGVTGAAKNTYYYREGDTNVEINGGAFTVADTTTATSNAQSTIAGGIFYYGGGDNRDKSAGTATIVGDVNLTITGGSFHGYNIYGGNYATAKSLGQYTSIDGNVTITLSVADNDLAFEKNAAGQTGNIYAGSYGFGTITGNAKVVLTGGEYEYQVNIAEENEEPVYETQTSKHTLSFTKLYGGSTGDFRTVAPSGFAVGKMESSIAGDRILSFEGFNGVIGTGSKIEGFNKVSFSKANDLGSFVADATFNADVTVWEIKSGATVENFEFDFSAGSYEYDFDQKKYVAANDTLILTGFTTEDIGGESFLGAGASVKDFTGLKVAFDDFAAVGIADDGTWKNAALGIQLNSETWKIEEYAELA